MNHYKGFAGAVKSVQCSPEGTSGEELVAACGLDRYLRIYSVNPPKLKHQVCKIHLTLLILNFVHVNDVSLVPRPSSSFSVLLEPTCWE